MYLVGSLVDRAMFPGTNPSYDVASFEELMWIPLAETTSAAKIPCVFVPYRRGSPYVIIYAHGNGTDLGDIIDRLDVLSSTLQAHILAFDYPGYGCFEGKASVSLVDNVLDSVVDFVETKLRWPIENIVLYGCSIGTGPCTRFARKIAEQERFMASQFSWPKTPIPDISLSSNYDKDTQSGKMSAPPRRRLGGLILQCPYRSIRHAAERFIGSFMARLLVESRWNIQEEVQFCACPILWIHGKKDELFDWKGSEEMYLKYEHPLKLFHASEAATHLVFDLYRDIVGPVRQFLNDMVLPYCCPVPHFSSCFHLTTPRLSPPMLRCPIPIWPSSSATTIAEAFLCWKQQNGTPAPEKPRLIPSSAAHPTRRKRRFQNTTDHAVSPAFHAAIPLRKTISHSESLHSSHHMQKPTSLSSNMANEIFSTLRPIDPPLLCVWPMSSRTSAAISDGSCCFSTRFTNAPTILSNRSLAGPNARCLQEHNENYNSVVSPPSDENRHQLAALLTRRALHPSLSVTAVLPTSCFNHTWPLESLRVYVQQSFFCFARLLLEEAVSKKLYALTSESLYAVTEWVRRFYTLRFRHFLGVDVIYKKTELPSGYREWRIFGVVVAGRLLRLTSGFPLRGCLHTDVLPPVMSLDEPPGLLQQLYTDVNFMVLSIFTPRNDIMLGLTRWLLMSLFKFSATKDASAIKNAPLSFTVDSLSSVQDFSTLPDLAELKRLSNVYVSDFCTQKRRPRLEHMGHHLGNYLCFGWDQLLHVILDEDWHWFEPRLLLTRLTSSNVAPGSSSPDGALIQSIVQSAKKKCFYATEGWDIQRLLRWGTTRFYGFSVRLPPLNYTPKCFKDQHSKVSKVSVKETQLSSCNPPPCESTTTGSSEHCSTARLLSASSMASQDTLVETGGTSLPEKRFPFLLDRERDSYLSNNVSLEANILHPCHNAGLPLQSDAPSTLENVKPVTKKADFIAQLPEETQKDLFRLIPHLCQMFETFFVMRKVVGSFLSKLNEENQSPPGYVFDPYSEYAKLKSMGGSFLKEMAAAGDHYDFLANAWMRQMMAFFTLHPAVFVLPTIRFGEETRWESAARLWISFLVSPFIDENTNSSTSISDCYLQDRQNYINRCKRYDTESSGDGFFSICYHHLFHYVLLQPGRYHTPETFAAVDALWRLVETLSETVSRPTIDRQSSSVSNNANLSNSTPPSTDVSSHVINVSRSATVSDAQAAVLNNISFAIMLLRRLLSLTLEHSKNKSTATANAEQEPQLLSDQSCIPLPLRLRYPGVDHPAIRLFDELRFFLSSAENPLPIENVPQCVGSGYQLYVSGWKSGCLSTGLETLRLAAELESLITLFIEALEAADIDTVSTSVTPQKQGGTCSSSADAPCLNPSASNLSNLQAKSNGLNQSSAWWFDGFQWLESYAEYHTKKKPQTLKCGARDFFESPIQAVQCPSDATHSSSELSGQSTVSSRMSSIATFAPASSKKAYNTPALLRQVRKRQYRRKRHYKHLLATIKRTVPVRPGSFSSTHSKSNK